MEKRKYTYLVIDRLEYYITKEIEKAIYGTGDKCFTALFQRLTECINARVEVSYDSIPNSVEELLRGFGYDDNFIDNFISNAKEHKQTECPGY